MMDSLSFGKEPLNKDPVEAFRARTREQQEKLLSLIHADTLDDPYSYPTFFFDVVDYQAFMFADSESANPDGISADTAAALATVTANLKQRYEEMRRIFDAEEFPLVRKVKALAKRSKTRTTASAGDSQDEAVLPAAGFGRQLDFFVQDILDASFKGERDSMEAPYFALNGNDLQPYHWTSVDGHLEVRITPPRADDPQAKPRPEKDNLPSRATKKSDVPARATIHDNDILIYLVSCLVQQLRSGDVLPDDNRVIMTPWAFFKATKKPCGKEAYIRLRDALERLARTYISRRVRNKKTGAWGREQGFSLIAAWDAIIDQQDARNTAIQVTLSEPFAEAIKSENVLQLHENYFLLRSGLAKALYRTARAKCGNQASWKISLEHLRTRVGSRAPLRNFRAEIRELEAADEIPEYKISLTSEDAVIFFNTSGRVKAPPLRIKTIRAPRKTKSTATVDK